MKPSAIYPITIGANQAFNLLVAGDYFKILSASGAVNVRAEWGELRGLIAGQGQEKSTFSRLTITDVSGATNNLRVFVGDENFIDGMQGTVNIGANAAPTIAAFTTSAAAVTNAAALLLAANTARKSLIIQNNHGSGALYLGATVGVTVANGLRVIPGGNWEPPVVPTCAIYAIGDLANNPNVVILEG